MIVCCLCGVSCVLFGFGIVCYVFGVCWLEELLFFVLDVTSAEFVCLWVYLRG